MKDEILTWLANFITMPVLQNLTTVFVFPFFIIIFCYGDIG